MNTISDIFTKYHNTLDRLDLELLIAHIIKKPREFVISHPEYKFTQYQVESIKYKALRKIKNEPIAYILGNKEFYGLPFKVNKSTLIPRPETELLVEKVLELNPKNRNIIDVGTGSGNIIITLVKKTKEKNNFYGIDIYSQALKVAKQNAKLNKVEKKIKFLKGNFFEPIIKSKNYKLKTTNCIITANLPYLSKKIYSAAMPDVKNFEPKSALYSSEEGLFHYKKLFFKIKILKTKNYGLKTIFLEFSPEQKNSLNKLAKNFFPNAKLKFYKDLAQKWRVLKIEI